MNIKTGILLLTFLTSGLLAAQQYRVYFTDKGDQPVQSPWQYLSQDALERRALRGIPLDYHDRPVASEYRRALREIGLVEIMHSRWLNYVKVEAIADPEAVLQLPFVKRIEWVEPMRVHHSAGAKLMLDTLIYGLAANQIEMLNGQYLHQRQQFGQGMRIAVLDAGFNGTLGLSGLDSLRADNRIKDNHSFIASDTNAFGGGSHGTQVLGVLAGYIDSQFVGTAWKADYYLYRTEFEPTETTVEMDNWLAAAERADSLGVDIITSSLGYTEFDGGVGSYDYLDMDGNTTIVTRAADMAASRGILVVVSAGNLGDAPWQFISAPADGDSVLAVGAVLPDGSYASFSSWGPTADGRIKPDVSAQGVATAILHPTGVSFGNGTSFSCPLVSGLAACLWQQDPSLSNMTVLEAIRSNASQSFQPDNRLGFGIANFRDAQWSISQAEFVPDKAAVYEVYPNPVADNLRLESSKPISGARLFDLNGKLIREFDTDEIDSGILIMPQSPGVYFLAVNIGNETFLEKIIIQ